MGFLTKFFGNMHFSYRKMHFRAEQCTFLRTKLIFKGHSAECHKTLQERFRAQESRTPAYFDKSHAISGQGTGATASCLCQVALATTITDARMILGALRPRLHSHSLAGSLCGEDVSFNHHRLPTKLHKEPLKKRPGSVLRRGMFLPFLPEST